MVVVGAGAAGLMAAIFAAREGVPVRVLEGTADGGRKILISGGGRCNVLPSRLSPEQYVTASSSHSLRRILLSWPLEEQRRFFEEDLGLRLVLEPETGKLFPEGNRARAVRDRLVGAAREAGAVLRFGVKVTELSPEGDGGWRVGTAGGAPVRAASVVVATGGLSVPQTGSDGTGLRLLAALGHTVHPTFPALTPLTAEHTPHAELAGISLDVEIRAPLTRGEFRTRGGFLFTHRGYSGPAVLNASHLAVLSEGRARQVLQVAWRGLERDAWEAMLRSAGSRSVGSVVRRELPERLGERLLREAGVPPERALSQLRREERTRLLGAVTAYTLPWSGDEGYRKAEVTGGGVALHEVDPATLESRIRRGLFVCGEALDAFGPIGGYNFAWAWATGRAAGRGVARRTRD